MESMTQQVPTLQVSTTIENENPNRKLAVRCRGVTKTYGSGEKTNYVLNDINISVPANTIYGLLGPSGCGKTTILKIICGLMQPGSGIVSVFGFRPGDPKSGCPGSGIGYMPQEVALQTDMTVGEMITYFGRLYFMPENVIRKQVAHLVDLLEIPDKNRLIGNLSGGQQRRVSLACTVIHKPRLCILDEPTVGVDPLLCQRIWELLLKFCAKDNMTIIITTHYIQECKRANTVGFMRKGVILEEGAPDSLCVRYETENLEDIFLAICMQQKKRHSIMPPDLRNARKSIAPIDDSQLDLVEQFVDYRQSKPFYAFFISILVLFWRYMLQSLREPAFLLLLFLFPTVALAFLYVCIGHTPKDLPTAWVVYEKPDYVDVHLGPNLTDVDFTNTVKVPYYPDVIKNALPTGILKLIEYNSLDAALKDISTRKIRSALFMSNNFSESFHQRINFFTDKDVSTGTIRAGTIYIHTDLSDKFLTITMQVSLQLTILEMFPLFSKYLGLSEHALDLPLQIGEPVYGNFAKGDFFGIRDFAAPGFILVITYSAAVGLAALALIKEKIDNMFSRNYSTGLTPSQIVFSQIASRFVFVSISAIIALSASILVFEVPMRGSFFAAIAILWLQTLAGMANGMALTSFFDDLFKLGFCMLGYIIFAFFMSGVFWPSESLPYYFRYLSKTQPFTVPTETLRSILIKKNAPFELIWPGFVISVSWFFVFTFFTIMFFKMKLQ